MFSYEFWEISENTSFTEHLRWLLLYQDISGRLLLILKKFNIQTFDSKYLNSNSNSILSILLARYNSNLDFVFLIDHVFRT